MMMSLPSLWTLIAHSLVSSASMSGSKRCCGRGGGRGHRAAGAVMLEDHVVLGHDLLTPDALDGGKPVADHLEDDVEALEREAGHHQAALARGAHEPVAGFVEVPEDLAKALGASLLGATEHRKKLGDRLLC